ncbi:MAG: DoxX family protein [Cephaloticoccus sp.]
MNAPTEKKFPLRFVPVVARLLLGLPLLVFGLNGFLNFIPQPEVELPEGAMAFSIALANTGYMFQLIGLTHLVTGLLLVVNRFVPFALVIFAPFVVNSVAFHVYLEPSGLVPSLVFAVLELYLAWQYRAACAGVLTAKVKPSAAM